MSKKLGIVLSHPVQYYAPMFRVFAQEINLVVFYGKNPSAEEQGSQGFGTAFKWDVDLLSGYKHIFIEKSKSIGTLIKEENCSHILVLGWQYALYRRVLWYCKLNSLPIAVRGDSQLGMQNKQWIRVAKKITYPFFLNLYTKILYVGKRNKQYLKQYLVPEKKLIFSPHCIDQAFWSAQDKDYANDNFITFLWVGKFEDKKHPMEAIRAFQQVEKNVNFPIGLNMVGSGKLLEACQNMTDSKNIKFLGFKNQTELRPEYISADCLLLTSDARETWGLVVNEAFAAGIPAIVSKACGCEPDLINETTGLSYEFGNLNSLIEKMEKMTSILNKNAKFFKEGLNKINNTYNFEHNLLAIKEFLNS